MTELREIIHNATLTKAQQMIAEYILDNSADACFMTSTEIAAKLGVSESSVIDVYKRQTQHIHCLLLIPM